MKRSRIISFAAIVLVIVMMVSLTALSAYAYSGSYTAGVAIGMTTVYSSTKKIESSSLSGSLPGGVVLSSDDNNFYISGSPQQVGTFECGCWVQLEDGTTENFKVSLTISDPVVTATPVAITSTPTRYDDEPTITKNPTAESVEVGGRAVFIARADNAEEIIWRLVSSDTRTTYGCDEASYYFSGLSVSGLGTEKLVLSNIPSSLNGWSVECKFVNDYGASYTNGAKIWVTSETAKAATISGQPKSVTQTMGNGSTLSVSASATGGGSLSYQWYTSSSASQTNLTAINGATSSSYTPPQTEGTAYYCVAVWNNKNGTQSQATYSDVVSVNYTAAVPTPTPTPMPTDTPAPTPETSAAPTATPGSSSYYNDNENFSLSASIIFFAITGVLAIVAIVVIIIFIKRAGNDDDDDE